MKKKEKKKNAATVNELKKAKRRGVKIWHWLLAIGGKKQIKSSWRQHESLKFYYEYSSTLYDQIYWIMFWMWLMNNNVKSQFECVIFQRQHFILNLVHSSSLIDAAPFLLIIGIFHFFIIMGKVAHAMKIRYSAKQQSMYHTHSDSTFLCRWRTAAELGRNKCLSLRYEVDIKPIVRHDVTLPLQSGSISINWQQENYSLDGHVIEVALEIMTTSFCDVMMI